jgi:hypothetical protein
VSENTEPAKTIGERLDELGWRQGSIVSEDTNDIFAEVLTAAGQTDLADALKAGTCCAVVLSQSCDVVCYKDEAEPYVEFIVAEIGDGLPNAESTFLKSFRDFSAQLADGTRHLRFKPWNRCFIERSRLLDAGISAQFELDFDAIRDVVDWLTTRYLRAALPNEFNVRLAAADTEKKIRKILDRTPLLTEVFLALKPRFEDLPAATAYECDVICLCRVADHSDAAKREAIEESILQIEKTLSSAKGIDVGDVRLRGEHQFTRHEMRIYDRWQLDDVTFRGRHRAATKGGDITHQFRVELDAQPREKG